VPELCTDARTMNSETFEYIKCDKREMYEPGNDKSELNELGNYMKNVQIQLAIFKAVNKPILCHKMKQLCTL
jgi:hypothetical protein